MDSQALQSELNTMVPDNASLDLLFNKLFSLSKNTKLSKDYVEDLFITLVKRFNSKKEKPDFYTWMVKMLHSVEIHKVTPDLTFKNGEDEHNVIQLLSTTDMDDDSVLKLLGEGREKDLEEILKDINDDKIEGDMINRDQIEGDMINRVRDIVSSVNSSLSASCAAHLTDPEEKILFDLCKAVEKTMKFKPRLTQMVSWCILVLSKSSQLVQVGTGEGKSCIVAMFAAYQAKERSVDIISSSPVLAERDEKEWRPFYKEMKITVNCNTSKDVDLKKCYGCNVVYGTAKSFAGDWLRHNFHRKGVRLERQFQCVIVDEVDSLLLDKGLEVVYLNSEMPAMQHLNFILARIWSIVSSIVSQHKQLDSKKTFGPVKLFHEIIFDNIGPGTDIDEFCFLQMAEDTGIIPKGCTEDIRRNSEDVEQKLECVGVIQMVDLFKMAESKFPHYHFNLHCEGDKGTFKQLNNRDPTKRDDRQEVSILLLKSGFCHQMYSDEEALHKSVKQSIIRYLLKDPQFTSDKTSQDKSHIPGFQALVNGKLQVWIENAFHATTLTKGREYILDGERVVPVDYSCTGVVQSDTKWGEGLQQFLEMKHQVKLSNMSVITNFMSNVGLFKKYKDQVYGISGTLGNAAEIEMLGNLYHGMKTCRMPSFIHRKLFEVEGGVHNNEKEWEQNICNVVREKVNPTSYRGPRAVLVICETINKANTIHSALKESIPSDKLKLYTNNNMDNSEVIDKPLKAGDVIIATNLAGRGTDLKVRKEVNKAGGLFVVQTFLPKNVRVEQQAFGRTARQGSPGSAQLIICSNDFSELLKYAMSISEEKTSFVRKYLGGLWDHKLSLLVSILKRLFTVRLIRYRAHPDDQSHEAMVSALQDILTIIEPVAKSDLELAKDDRDILVKVRLSGFLENDIPKITKKEELFSDYLELVDAIYKENESSNMLDAVVSSLHECWGMWLLMSFNEKESPEKLKERFKVDMQSAKEKLESKMSPSSAIHYYVRAGNELRLKGSHTERIDMYTRAIEEHHGWPAIVLYNRASSTIKKGDNGYVIQALGDLEKAEKAVELQLEQLQNTLQDVIYSGQDSTRENSARFKKQFETRMQVVEHFKANIQDAVKKLQEAKASGGNVCINEQRIYFLMLPNYFTFLSFVKVATFSVLGLSHLLMIKQLIVEGLKQLCDHPDSMNVANELINFHSLLDAIKSTDIHSFTEVMRQLMKLHSDVEGLRELMNRSDGVEIGRELINLRCLGLTEIFSLNTNALAGVFSKIV